MSIAFTTPISLSAGDIALDLCVTHVLCVGSSSTTAHLVKRWDFGHVDVALDPAFSISLAGIVNGIPVPETIIMRSTPFSRLQDYLDRQACNLGFARAYTEDASRNPHS